MLAPESRLSGIRPEPPRDTEQITDQAQSLARPEAAQPSRAQALSAVTSAEATKLTMLKSAPSSAALRSGCSALGAGSLRTPTSSGCHGTIHVARRPSSRGERQHDRVHQLLAYSCPETREDSADGRPDGGWTVYVQGAPDGVDLLCHQRKTVPGGVRATSAVVVYFDREELGCCWGRCPADTGHGHGHG